MNSTYRIKDVIWYSGMLVGLCVLMMPTKGAGFLALVFCALVALFRRKSEQLVWCLLLANAILIMNNFFAPKDFVFGISHRALLVITGFYGALLFLTRKPNRFVMPLLGIVLYLVYMTIPSSLGWDPTISILKILLFLSVYMALAYASNSAAGDRRVDTRKLRAMMLALAVFFIVGSVLVAPFPAISSMTALEVLESGGDFTSLYKGACNHSQTLGMVMAFWVIFLFADLIFHVQKFDKLYIFLILFAMGLLYKSSGRTAMGTMIACCGFAYLFFRKYRGSVRAGWKAKLSLVVIVLAILGGFAAIAVPQIRDGVVRFAMKYDRTAGAGDFDVGYAISTRQGLVDEQLYNFHRRPAIGWGFQVSEQVAEMSKGTKGLLLSAPVEKGVWVTAILEEGGVCGEIIYVGYLIVAIVLLYARRAFMGLTIFLAVHISNLGEMTMFSMSGCGGMWYTFLFIALIFDAKRIEANSLQQQGYYYPSANPVW